MGRFFLTLIGGLALFLGVAWAFGLFVHAPENTGLGQTDSTNQPSREIGAVLYPAKPLPPEPPFPENGRVSDPIVISGHIVANLKTEFGPQTDGQIKFVGEQVPHEAVCLAGAAPFSADPFQYTFINQAGQDLIVIYRPFRRDQVVEKDQMVVLLDPAKAMSEYAKALSKTEVAVQEHKGAVLTYREAEQRFEQARRLWERTPPLIAAEEYREKKLARDKFQTESEAKKMAIVMAKKEAEIAAVLLKQHYMRNPLERAIIKSIYHDRGDSVKNQDPILQLYSTYKVEAEGQVEVQYHDRLYEGMPVTVEPTYEDPPFRTLRGHKLEVNAVAVSKDSKLFVSASEDRTANVWVKEMNVPRWVLPHRDPVRSVVCAPPGGKENWCLTGCANGAIYLWNLDQPEKEPLKLEEHAHRDAVTALAFSPDGTYFASGSADNSILVWKTGAKEPMYAVDDHAPTGPVTALAFTPQCRLVSASRDNTLRVWELHEKGAQIVGEPVYGRAGNVNQLGVSNDGRLMLFDQGKTLQFLSVQSGRMSSIPLQNNVGGMSFETLALFSPDASLLLTAGGQEGRLQVWKTPTSFSSGYEVRQYVSEDKSPVTCAAFAPDAGLAATGVASFAISGSKDGAVYLWPVPSKQAVETHRIRNVTLTSLGRATEAGTRQIRVGVQLNNPDGRLMDGRPATIVIEP